MDKDKVRHIGDDVYVKYDGYHLVLMANSPDKPTDTIYLDHRVRNELAWILNKLKDQEQ